MSFWSLPPRDMQNPEVRPSDPYRGVMRCAEASSVESKLADSRSRGVGMDLRRSKLETYF